MDCKRVVTLEFQDRDVVDLSELSVNWVKLEWEAEAFGEIGELFSCLEENFHGSSHGGHGEMWGTFNASGEDVEQGWPLEAVYDVEVDDVNSVSAVECFEDGLVGGEVGELDEGGDVVEDLEGGLNRVVVDERSANAEP